MLRQELEAQKEAVFSNNTTMAWLRDSGVLEGGKSLVAGMVSYAATNTVRAHAAILLCSRACQAGFLVHAHPLACRQHASAEANIAERIQSQEAEQHLQLVVVLSMWLLPWSRCLSTCHGCHCCCFAEAVVPVAGYVRSPQTDCRLSVMLCTSHLCVCHVNHSLLAWICAWVPARQIE